jgi:hypothetical protein
MRHAECDFEIEERIQRVKAQGSHQDVPLHKAETTSLNHWRKPVAGFPMEASRSGRERIGCRPLPR